LALSISRASNDHPRGHEKRSSGKNSRALQGHLPGAIGALERQDGASSLTHGSGKMVRQLLTARLVDEHRFLTYPVVLGRGKRLFGDDARAFAFTLAHSTSTRGGVPITRHVRSGEVRTGTFEWPHPRGQAAGARDPSGMAAAIRCVGQGQGGTP
jgi:dihydrofolate reductase